MSCDRRAGKRLATALVRPPSLYRRRRLALQVRFTANELSEIPELTPPQVPITVEHPAEGIVYVEIDDEAANPLVLGSGWAPIHFAVQITIDRSVPGLPTYTVTGTHARFPAYEVYINNQRVHEYSPIPSGSGIGGLPFFDRTFNNHGSL
jgi:hypothetical protein